MPKHTVHFSTSQSARPPFRVPTLQELDTHNARQGNEQYITPLTMLIKTHQMQHRHATVCYEEILTLDSRELQCPILSDQRSVYNLQLILLFHQIVLPLQIEHHE